MTGMKAWIYARVNPEDIGSIYAQIADGKVLAKQRGWTVAGESQELGNGRDAGHSEFQRLLTAIEGGEAGAVVAVDWTRLARSPERRKRLLEAGKGKGIVVALVTGGDFDLSALDGLPE